MRSIDELELEVAEVKEIVAVFQRHIRDTKLRTDKVLRLIRDMKDRKEPEARLEAR